MEQIDVTQNDKGYDMLFEVTNADDTPMDLTGVTAIAMHLVDKNDSTSTKNLTCAVFGTATDGIVKYTVAQNDFSVVTSWIAEIQISFGSSKVLTLPTFRIVVAKELA